MSTAYVETEIRGRIAWITLNRPEKLNALTTAMYAEIERALGVFGSDPTVHCIVLRGRGRAFSSGFDRKEPVNDLAEALRQTNRCRWAIWRCPVPVLLAVQGYCLGGALELSYPADLVLAAEDCLFGVPEVKDGVGAGFNMLPWLMNHKLAKASMLSGGFFSAREAQARGLVTHVVPLGGFDAAVDELAASLADVPRATLRDMKRSTNLVYEKLGMERSIEAHVDNHAGVEMFHD